MTKFFKNSKKSYLGAILGHFWPNLDKNEFSWKTGCQFLNIPIITFLWKIRPWSNIRTNNSVKKKDYYILSANVQAYKHLMHYFLVYLSFKFMRISWEFVSSPHSLFFIYLILVSFLFARWIILHPLDRVWKTDSSWLCIKHL